MQKFAKDVVGFFAVIVNAIGRFLLGVLKIIWFPFGAVLKFLAELLKGFAKAVSIVAVALAKAIAATVKAISKAAAVTCRAIYTFCKTKPMATIVLFALGWLTLFFVLPTLYVWDASFYSRQASPVLPLWTYIAVGLTFRTIIVIGPSFFIRSIVRREWMAACIWLVLSAISLPACILAAMGAVTEGQDYHFRNASAITDTKNVSVGSFDEQIERIVGEKETERLTTEKLIAGARESMREVTTDGDPSNDDLSTFEANIRLYTQDGKSKQEALDGQIAVLEATKLTAQTTATDKAVTEPPIAAVYQFPARYVPTVQPMAFRDASAVYWVIGLEIIGFLLPGTLYAAHLVAAHRIPMQNQPKVKAPKPKRRFRWAFWNKLSDLLFVPAPPPPPVDDQPTPEEIERKRLEDEEAALKAALANADVEQRIAELKAQLEKLRNPPPAEPKSPPPEEKPPLTDAQQNGQNGGLANDLLNKTKDQVIKIPVGQWSARADRIKQKEAA
jgi:hypothetical protein